LVLWQLTPPKNIFQNADFVDFAKQNQQNRRSGNIILLPSAAEFRILFGHPHIFLEVAP